MINKKGLSDIIATVLIVLLALAAIAIVWAIISPMLRETGGQIETSEDLVNTNFLISRASVDGSNNVNVIVQRDKGGANTFALVVLTSSGGQTFSYSAETETSILQQFETASITIPPGTYGLNNVVKVEVYPAIKDASGRVINANAPSDTEIISAGGGPGCSNECSPNGAQQCSGTQIQSCGEAGDGDICLEWLLPTDCQSGYSCVNNQCTPLPQCSDGIDNDNDGATDYPEDNGCSSLQDNSESLCGIHTENPDGTCTAEISDIIEDGFIVKDVSGSIYTRKNAENNLVFGNIGGEVNRAYVEWNIVSIPDTATINEVRLKYHGDQNVGSSVRRVTRIDGGQISTEQDDSLIYGWIGSTVYMGFLPSNFPVAGPSREVTLLSSFNTGLRNNLPLNWFAVGMRLTTTGEATPGDYASIYSEDYVPATPAPTLVVKYTPA